MKLQMIIWFSIVTVVCSVGIFFIGRRLIKPMKWKSPYRQIAWTILSAIFLFPVASMIFTRVWKGNDLLFSWITYVGLGFISFIFTLLFLRDAVLFLSTLIQKAVSLFKKEKNLIDPSRREFLLQSTNIGIIGASALATSYGIYEARKAPGIVPVDIPIQRLPHAFDGFRIVQISDIHAGLTVDRKWIETVVEEVQKLSPDLIAFTGDMADGSVAKLESTVAPLGELTAPYGKFFTTGNHEYYSGAPEWIKHAGVLGYDVLMNEHRAIEKNGAKIILAGVTDYSAGQFFADQASDPRKAIEQAPNDMVKILMAHQPRTLYQTNGLEYDFVMNGHTHGGQFFPWNYLATFGQPFIKGLHRWDKSLVYVSKGTGYWGPPVRLGARSEITVLTLRKA
ncbi:MAG: metallophosphoesterase [Bacteroidota bacterium]|jgi:hypothetical protein